MRAGSRSRSCHASARRGRSWPRRSRPISAAARSDDAGVRPGAGLASDPPPMEETMNAMNQMPMMNGSMMNGMPMMNGMTSMPMMNGMSSMPMMNGMGMMPMNGMMMGGMGMMPM